MLLTEIANAIIAMDRVPNLDLRRNQVRQLLSALEQLAADTRVHEDTRINLMCKVARHLDPTEPRRTSPTAQLAAIHQALDGRPPEPATTGGTAPAADLIGKIGDALYAYCTGLGLPPETLRPYGAATAIIRRIPGLTAVPMPRPNTPETRRGTATVLTVKRACNGCNGNLGDVTAQEMDAAVAGQDPPDARHECPRCTPPTWPPTPVRTPLSADAAYDNLVAAVRDELDAEHVFVPGGYDSTFGPAGTWCAAWLDEGTADADQCGQPLTGPAARHIPARPGPPSPDASDPVAADFVHLWGIVAPLLPDFPAAEKAVLAAGYELLPAAKERYLADVMAAAHIHGARSSAVAAAILYSGWARTPGQETGEARDTRISEVLTEKDPTW